MQEAALKAGIAPAATLQRTAYMEAKARKGAPTEFAIEYEVTLMAQYHPIDPDQVQPIPREQSLAPFLADRSIEARHSHDQ